jgi:ketosteroid isomerase-like protein
MKKFLLALAFFVAMAASAQAQTSKAAIDKGNRAWIIAFNKGDAASIAQLYTEQATIFPPGAAMAKGRPAIEKFWRGAIEGGIKNAALQTLSIEQHGSIAREIGRFSLEMPDADKKPVRVEGKYVVIWKKVGPAWMLDIDIWNADK